MGLCLVVFAIKRANIYNERDQVIAFHTPYLPFTNQTTKVKKDNISI